MIEEIIKISQEAGDILLKHFKKNEKIDYKTDKFDPVTLADKESSKFIIKELKKLYSNDFFISEEKDDKKVDYSKNVWIIDPLDGTNAFVRGEKDFCVIIGLLKNKKPYLGVIHVPVSGETFYAVKNKGAYKLKNSIKTRLTVSNVPKIEDSTMMFRKRYGRTTVYDGFFKKIVVKKKNLSPSMGLMLLSVASKKSDFGVKAGGHVAKWDTLAGQVILEESGGLLTHYDGSFLDYTNPKAVWQNHMIFSNKILHEKIIELLK